MVSFHEWLREQPKSDNPWAVCAKNLLCSLHFAGLQAGSANIHLLSAFSNFDPNGLDVGFPDVIGPSMRMADIVAKVHAFSANSAFCHNRTSFHLVMQHTAATLRL